MNIDFSSLYEVSPEDKVFVDANVLIFLFSPDFVFSEDYQVDKYSKIYQLLLENECKLFVNSLVISEYINKCLRIDFKRNVQTKDNTKLFKDDYRNSQRYKDTLSIILKELKKFLSFNVIQLNDGFSGFDVFAHYEENIESDFNDMIIAKNVIENDLFLLSDDGDFRNNDSINTNWYMK